VTVMAILEVKDLSRHFGGLAAVNKVSVSVEEGEIIGLIGPNGAGKSTVLNLIDGTLKVSGGTIAFRGRTITRYPPHRRAHLGIARVFQKNALFKSMTVLENITAGAYLRTRHGPWGVIGHTYERVRRQPDVVARAQELLDAVMAELHRSHDLVDKVYALEKDLPSDWKDPLAPKVETFARERLDRAAEFTASLFLTAWQDSEYIEFPQWHRDGE